MSASRKRLEAAVEEAGYDIIPNSTFKQDMSATHATAHKFEDPFVGYAVMFAGLDPEYAKSIGIR